MKKFVLLPLVFTIAMTFFSLSCLEDLASKIEGIFSEGTEQASNVQDTNTDTNTDTDRRDDYRDTDTYTDTDRQSNSREENEILRVHSVEIAGTGTARTITATVPSSYLFDAHPKEYSYSLYYLDSSFSEQVRDSIGYSGDPREITSFLPITNTGSELKDIAWVYAWLSNDFSKISSVPNNPNAGESITFDISGLNPDALYLYLIETYHPSKANSYTAITETRGWFKTAP